jgi:chromosome segregation ATPase
MSEDLTQHLPQDGVRLILARLDSIDSRLGNVENRISNLETRLSALEDKVDRRLQETRPIWEQVLVRLDAVEGQLVGFNGRMVSFEGRIDGFEKRLDGFEEELHSSLRRFGRQVEVSAKDVFEVRADQRDLVRWMDKLEPLEPKAT